MSSAGVYRVSVDGFSLREAPVEQVDPRVEKRTSYHGSTFLDPEGVKEKNVNETSISASLSSQDRPIYVEFADGDKRNPMNASYIRKWVITLLACLFTALSAGAGPSIALGFPSMERDLNCSDELASLALGIYCLGFGVFPLITASLSEEFGRKPLFIVSAVVFMLSHLMMALAKNIATVIIGRLLAGASGSTGATMVGGVVADIWSPSQRGLPMSLFALCAIGATALGAILAGFIEQNAHLEWRWIQWIGLILSGAYVVAVCFVMGETRGGIILTKEARKLRKETGDNRYRARAEDEVGSLKQLVIISCTRPLYLLFTEPVVASFSLWVGVAWGVLYSEIEAISLVFKTLYGFNDAQAGLSFIPMLLGALAGFILNFYQERLYTRYVHKYGPEARLFSALVAAILFPAGCFIFAWTGIPSVHAWVAPMVGIFVFITGLYMIYQSVFLYLADAYSVYASSALAGQSLCRNLLGTVFPLFTHQMYTRLTFKWASTLFGCLAAVLAVVPFILFVYGPRIRANSKFARRLAEQQAEIEVSLNVKPDSDDRSSIGPVA